MSLRRPSDNSLLLLAALSIAILADSATAADFSQFRGPSGDGHAPATGLPVTWNPTKHVTWHTCAPGQSRYRPRGRSSGGTDEHRIVRTCGARVTGGAGETD